MVLPSFQAMQFSAAAGLSRMLLILGAMEPTITGENVSEDVVQRQVSIVHKYSHSTVRHVLKAAVDCYEKPRIK